MHFYYKNGEKLPHENKLVIGIYYETEADGRNATWELVSVRSAKNLPPFQLCRFINAFEYVFPSKIQGYKAVEEAWYKVTIRFLGYEAHEFEIIAVENVSDTEDPYDRIH